MLNKSLPVRDGKFLKKSQLYTKYILSVLIFHSLQRSTAECGLTRRSSG